MSRNYFSARFVGQLSRVLSFSLLFLVVAAGIPSSGAVGKVDAQDAQSDQPVVSTEIMEPPSETFPRFEVDYPSAVPKLDSKYSDLPPISEGYPEKSNFSTLTVQEPWVEIPGKKTSIEVGSDGLLPVPSEVPGGELSGGIDPRNLLGGITVDLTYDVVMGFVNPGETVLVAYGSTGYGAAVADDVGFFWTPIWDITDGHQIGIDCGMTISITVEGNPSTIVVPPCMTGAIDIETDTISGIIPGIPENTEVYFQIGVFYPIPDETGRINPKPPGNVSIENVYTASDGSFSYQPGFASNLGAESLFSVDFQVNGIWIRSYVYPEQNVFMIQQYNTIAGYAEEGKTVAAEIVDGGSTLKWSGSTTAYGPHGFYTFTDLSIESGNSVEVQVEGESLMTTTVDYLGDFVFDVDSDTLSGTAPAGKLVRAVMWQYDADALYYQEDEASATTGDLFTIDWIMDEGHEPDLRPRDQVLVIVPDANGNQLQILSGPPFVSAYISLDSNLDCVFGRLDEPGLPIFVSLDKGAGEIYTRDTGFFTDVGNSLGGHCFVIRDGEGNFVDFSPGDFVTLESDDPSKWSGSVEVVDFAWSGDTENDSISGTTADGDLELTLYQWQDGSYPLRGATTMSVPVSSGTFNASFPNFDVRDGVMMDFSHYNASTGYGTQTNWWSYWPTLPYFELQLPYGISGMVGSPGETVTASLFNGLTQLAETSNDENDDPYWFWLDDFQGNLLEPGYRVEVSTSGGWSGEMVVPDLSIDGDVGNDKVSAIGPSGLLFLEVYDYSTYLTSFIPGPNSLLDTVYYGWDLYPSDFISVTYQAVDGNRARLQNQLHEVSEVNFWFNPGNDDWMWGSAKPGTTVTAKRDSITLFNAYADPACGGCWNIDESIALTPGDEITVTAGDGLLPVVILIPDPLTAYADSSTEEVWGQIDHLDIEMVDVNGNWEEGYQEVYTDSNGNYSAIYPDIPNGGDGYVHYYTMRDWAHVNFNQYFRTPDLVMDINYAHDWIEGWYPPGYEVTLTVTESDKLTEKASITLTTAEIPWWGGGTGFSTSIEGAYWDPEQPDIQAGDWVLGEVVVDTTTYFAEVQVGEITGDVDVASDSITGKINASWLPQDVEIQMTCHPWGGPENVDQKFDSVRPNGMDEYQCEWDPVTEWDVEAYQDIGVSYQVSEGHTIYNAFFAYSDELIMRIHYDHEWIEGNYEPGHEVHLTVYDSLMIEKAHITVPTGPIADWGGNSGFATYLESSSWIPGNPDLEPGDVVHGEVDDGTQYWADVEIGTITGIPDVASDSISGTLDADWLLPGPVDIVCSIWEENGPEIYTNVTPDGETIYECDFSSTFYDIIPGTNLMVSYLEPDGHQVYGDFSLPAPYLKIEKWFIGDGTPGVGGNAAFWVQYQNQGNEDAVDVTITDTMVGMSYLGDTSGFAHTGGDTELTWDLGTVMPGEWVGFVLFTRVTGGLGDYLNNTIEITTSNPFDEGEAWEKISIWEGTVAENDTHLSLSKDSWTWNPAPGQDFIYQVNVCNNGSTSSTAVTLTETLPEATVFGSWWGADVGWQEVSQVGDVLVVEHSCISPQTCTEIYIRVSVEPDAMPGDELINHVAIVADNDLSTGDDEVEVQHNVGEPKMDLRIEQNWHWGSLVPGGYYRYGIYFRNEGNLPASGPIEIAVELPAGTSFNGWDSWGWTGVGTPVINGNQVTWTLEQGLDPGFDGLIEVWVDISQSTTPGTILEHLADIEIQLGEEDTDNNHSEFVDYVRDPGPNLRVQKYGDWHGGQEGQSAWWQIQVENIGDETVNGVELFDYYPDEMELDGEVYVDYWEYWEWSDNDPEDNTFRVYLDRLEPGWTVSINYNTYVREEVILTPAMNFSNLVDVPLVEDIQPENNAYEYVLVYIGPRPHLRIEKYFIGEGSPGEGGNAAFWIQYQNQGDLAADFVEITDLLEGMDYISDTSELPTTVDGNQVTWDVGTVEPGDWIGFVLFAEVTAPLYDPVSNTVWISTTTPYDEGDESEKMSTWEGEVVENDTHLNVGKDTWTWNPAPGQDFVYQINVCNNGSTSSSTLNLIDTLPSATSFTDWWSWDVGWYIINQTDEILELGHESISGWTCSEVFVRVTVDPLAEPGDDLFNLVTISADNDIETDDNYAELHHTVGEPYTDLAVWHDWWWGILVPGGHYRYGITFRNEGNMAVEGDIEITATLPEGTSFAGWDYPEGWEDVPDPTVVGSTITWVINGILPGTQGTIGVWVDINLDTLPGAVLEDFAEIEVQLDETNTGNNSSMLTTNVQEKGLNLRVRKQGEWHGDESDFYASYHLQVENIGDEIVHNVVVTDTFPVGLTLRDGPHVDFWEDWNCDVYDEYFTCILSRMDPGWNMSISFELTPDNPDPGYIYTNTAEVGPLEGDKNPDDNYSIFDLFSGPDMIIEKKFVEGEFLPGEEVTYLLRFGNAYTDGDWWGTPWWWGMAGNAIITDTLPEGMSYVSAYHHWCGEEVWEEYAPDFVGQDLIWTHDPIGYYNCFEILLTVEIVEIEEGNPMINEVMIASDQPEVDIDPYPDNNISFYDPELGWSIFLPLIMR